MWHFPYFMVIVLLVGLGCWDEMFANLDTLFDPVTSICLCQILLVLNLTLRFLLWWCCLIRNSLHIGMHYIDINVGPIAHMMMETTVHLPWIDMNFRLCWSFLLFCHKLIPPLAYLLIVGFGVVLDDSLFGYEPWVYWQRSCLITTNLSSLMFLNVEEWMETSVKSVW